MSIERSALVVSTVASNLYAHRSPICGSSAIFRAILNTPLRCPEACSGFVAMLCTDFDKLISRLICCQGVCCHMLRDSLVIITLLEAERSVYANGDAFHLANCRLPNHDTREVHLSGSVKRCIGYIPHLIVSLILI